MAKPSKPKTSGSKPSSAKPKPDTATQKDDVAEESAADSAEQPPAEPREPKNAAAAPAQDDAVAPAENDAAAQPDNGTEPAETPAAPVITPPPPQRVGFFNVVLGGVVAAGLGAGALYLAQNRGWIAPGGTTETLQARLESQSGQIADLRAALDSAVAQLDDMRPDTEAIGQSLDALRASDDGASAELVALAETVANLRKRLNEVETQPIPKAELPAEVVAAYEAQLADVLAAVDTRFTELKASLDGKLAEIEAAQTAAAQAEQEALNAADAAAARAAMSRITIALENGTGFADDLDEAAQRAGMDPPPALADVAASGVPTLTVLMADFPEAARTALKASTEAAASDGSVTPLAAFFRTQLGARSLEPRAGDDADAVLSRAEAAVRQGDLATALTEIAALPQAGQQALAGWVAKAETRRAALAAAAEISAQLNSN